MSTQRGECPFCRRSITLHADGSLQRHAHGIGEIAGDGAIPQECAGSGRLPRRLKAQDTIAPRHDDDDQIDHLKRDLAHMTADRNRHRARVNLLENILHELDDEVRAQRRTAAYQNSHGQPATAGRRRIDLESFLSRAGIEVKP